MYKTIFQVCGERYFGVSQLSFIKYYEKYSRGLRKCVADLCLHLRISELEPEEILRVGLKPLTNHLTGGGGHLFGINRRKEGSQNGEGE
jgi:hypothetical protein